jgi:hypothetical protein
LVIETFANNVYDFVGLDAQGTRQSADKIPDSHSVNHYREEETHHAPLQNLSYFYFKDK